MSEENAAMGYGYSDDEGQQFGGLIFGLNSGVSKLAKFEFNPNGGADDGVQDACDVVFNVDGRDISYRLFPVTQAYDSNGNIVKDPKHEAFLKAVRDLNSIITHILHCFVEKSAIQAAMSAPIKSFEQYIKTAQALMPQGYEDIVIDIFGQWQWEITGDNDRTYLRFPKSMKHGKWLCKHIAPEPDKDGENAEWTSKITNGKLIYIDGAGNVHPFKRSKWFMESNFAKAQKQEKVDDIDADESAPAVQDSDWNEEKE